MIRLVVSTIPVLAVAVGLYGIGTLAGFSDTEESVGNAITAAVVDIKCGQGGGEPPSDQGEGPGNCQHPFDDGSHCTTSGLVPTEDIAWGTEGSEACDTIISNASTVPTVLYLEFEYVALPDDGSCEACNGSADLLASDFTLTKLEFAGTDLLGAGGPFDGATKLGDLVSLGCTKVAGLAASTGGTLSLDSTLDDVSNTRQGDSGDLGLFFLVQQAGAPPPSVCNDDLGTQTCQGHQATIVGTDGDDRLKGTNGDDVIVGLKGNDKIDGRRGADIICGNQGDDKIDGKGGDDILDGGPGNDDIRGGKGKDHIIGGIGDDKLRGGGGSDILDGGPGDDDCKDDPGSLFIDCEP